MVEETQRIEIPIEISTGDMKELNNILSRIEKAENSVSKIRNDTRAVKEADDLAAGVAPIQTTTGPDEDSALPRGFKYKDVTSRAPVQRPNQLTNRIGELEEEQKGIKEILTGGGFELIGGQGGMIMKTISKFLPILGSLFVAKGIVDFWAQYLFGPGGIWDRRYKRDILKEMVRTIGQDMKKQIRAATVETRVSSYSGIRGGKGLSFTNLTSMRKGKPLYDINLEHITKGAI